MTRLMVSSPSLYDRSTCIMTDAPVLLSCEQCKKRKTKCDKTFPRCSACKAANINCQPVQRSRLPRGRTGSARHKSATLAEKVARLESLVGRLEAQIHDHDETPPSIASSTRESESNAVRTTSRVEDLLAKDFWIALSKEVTGLRETLEGTDGEDIQQSDTAEHRFQPGVQTTSNLLLFNGAPETFRQTDTYINQSMREVLIQVYYDRVDILFKVTHWPIVMKMLQSNDNNNVTSRSNIASISLEWCICFTAATTLSDQDCHALHLGSRMSLIEHCRLSAENFLSQSNFLIDPTFLTVQAFTIYLMGLRTCGQGALTWTLVALAIRVATALDLGSETNNTLSALDIEQRRRVWFAIGVLDSQAAFGRGSIPILPHRDLKHPPLNINDAEVGIRTASAHPSTEMSFSCVTHQAVLCQRRLCDPLMPSFQDRAEIVTAFESTMRRNHAHLETSNVLIERYTALLAKDIIMNMHLLLRRPPYKSISSDANYHLSKLPPFDILITATAILERGLSKQHSPEFQKWSWFAWPRWYALAIVLVELCSLPINPLTDMEMDGHTDRNRGRDIAKIYHIATHSFTNYAQSASDISSGTIWTPIVKLMKRVQQIHGPINTSSSDTYPAPASAPTYLFAEPEITPNQLSQNTILSRYCDAMSDPRTNPPQPDIETNPDLLWDAFLEDLGEPTVPHDSSHSSISPAAISTFRPPFEVADGSGSTSTWSLMPYLPILPQLDSRYTANVEGQEQGRKTRRKGGHSVLGAIIS